MPNTRFVQMGSPAFGPRLGSGFTLLELMIVVAIIAILAGVAYPNYSKYAFRSRRADGKEMLMRVAAAQERYYTNFNHYASQLGTGTDGLGFGPPSCSATVGDSEKCAYNVSIGGGSTAVYTLTATPQGAQATDECKALILDNTGQKSVGPGSSEGNGKCW